MRGLLSHRLGRSRPPSARSAERPGRRRRSRPQLPGRARREPLPYFNLRLRSPAAARASTNSPSALATAWKAASPSRSARARQRPPRLRSATWKETASPRSCSSSAPAAPTAARRPGLLPRPGTSTYRSVEQDFGDPGAVIADLAGDRRLEFESADDRFAYEFAPYAYSGLPLAGLALPGRPLHRRHQGIPRVDRRRRQAASSRASWPIAARASASASSPPGQPTKSCSATARWSGRPWPAKPALTGCAVTKPLMVGAVSSSRG